MILSKSTQLRRGKIVARRNKTNDDIKRIFGDSFFFPFHKVRPRKKCIGSTNAQAVRCMYCEGRLLHREISHFLPAVEAGKRRRSQTKIIFFSISSWSSRKKLLPTGHGPSSLQHWKLEGGNGTRSTMYQPKAAEEGKRIFRQRGAATTACDKHKAGGRGEPGKGDLLGVEEMEQQQEVP